MKPALPQQRAGTVIVLVVLSIVVFLAMALFATELGRMYVVRSQMQNSVDAGSIAASLTLREDSDAFQEAVTNAKEFVRLNRVGMLRTVPEEAITAEAGAWDADAKSFSPGGSPLVAVRVHATSANEPFFIAKMFGHSTFSIPGQAIATGGAPAADIMLVLDLSSSMSSQGRIQALRNAAPLFVDVIEESGPDDKIGVMGLSAHPSMYQTNLYNSGLHPTNDHHRGVLEADLTDDFDSLRDSTLSAGGLKAGKYRGWFWFSYTGTGAALGDAVHYLKHNPLARDDTNKVVVLMSDGEANRPTGNGSGYALEMAAYALAQNVKVYTISLGNQADLVLMQSIADVTDGEHFDATGSGELLLTQRLTEAFQRAAGRLRRTQLVQ